MADKPRNHCYGFSLCEVLISIMILTIGILAITKMQLLAIQNDEDAYFYSVGENQLQTMTEYIAFGSLPHSDEIQQWNNENAWALPQGVGYITGQGPYIVVLNWLGRKVRMHYKTSMVIPRGS